MYKCIMIAITSFIGSSLLNVNLFHNFVFYLRHYLICYLRYYLIRSRNCKPFISGRGYGVELSSQNTVISPAFEVSLFYRDVNSYQPSLSVSLLLERE